MSNPQYDDQIKTAKALAAGVRSFLSSLPYMAPEMIGPQAKTKLADPLDDFSAALDEAEGQS